jgi:hypothetical protein
MTPREQNSELVSLKEAAVILDLRDERTVRRELERHDLSLIRLGRSVRVERAAIAALIAGSRSSAPRPSKDPSIETAKNRVAARRLPDRAAMKNTNSPIPRQPRRGWRQAFPNEPGLYRLHRVECPASPTRSRQPKCSCSF